MNPTDSIPAKVDDNRAQVESGDFFVLSALAIKRDWTV
jgi:hypothetical protein